MRLVILIFAIVNIVGAVAAEDPIQGAKELATATKELTYLNKDLNYPVRDLLYPIQDLDAKVQPLKKTETDLEVKFELSGDVLFDFDKAEIRPVAEPVLAEVAEQIKMFKKPKVTIDGYTDNKGDDTYNLKLSKRRADSVKSWLAAKKAEASYTTKGFGEVRPVAPNSNKDGSDSPEGRQKNRRVEIVVKKL